MVCCESPVQPRSYLRRLSDKTGQIAVHVGPIPSPIQNRSRSRSRSLDVTTYRQRCRIATLRRASPPDLDIRLCLPIESNGARYILLCSYIFHAIAYKTMIIVDVSSDELLFWKIIYLKIEMHALFSRSSVTIIFPWRFLVRSMFVIHEHSVILLIVSETLKTLTLSDKTLTFPPNFRITCPSKSWRFFSSRILKPPHRARLSSSEISRQRRGNGCCRLSRRKITT